jgi:hypothetical protein
MFSSFLIVWCAISALKQTCETNEQTEETQLRIARIVGIAMPLLSLVLAMNRIKLSPSLMFIALSIVIIHIVVFLFLIKEKNLYKNESINIPQLLVICSSLVFSSHAGFASMATKLKLSELPDSLVVEYSEKLNEYEGKKNKKITSIETEVFEKKPVSKEEVMSLHDLFKQDRIARTILDEEFGIPIIPMNRLRGDMAHYYGTHRAYIELSEKQIPNIKFICTFFPIVWLGILFNITKLYEKDELENNAISLGNHEIVKSDNNYVKNKFNIKNIIIIDIALISIILIYMIWID